MKVNFETLFTSIFKYHTYKSVNFSNFEIPEGIGPLSPLPSMTLSK